jgi:4-amino-4-deoxy-L-arabinose transferase
MKKSSVLIIGLFLSVYIAPLGIRPITVPDECRYAEIPREMLVSGDCVVPHLNGLRYFEKPPLGYWLNAASIKLFGENAFAVRLPSALSAGATALAVFMGVLRFGGGYSAGILAAAALLTCLEVFAVGTFSLLDSMFSLFVTGGMISFFFAYMEEESKKRTGLLALAGLFFGLAFLTKGFIAFAMPVVAIVPFMIWEGRWKELFRIPWVPTAAAVGIALPWAVMIHLREPDFWHYFFWTEHIKRFFSDNAQHTQPFWYLVPVLMVGALPWTSLFPAAIQGLRKAGLKDPLIRFSISGFLFPFLFFSASRGKLGTYILPCFPPLVILISIGLMNFFKWGKKRAFNIGAFSLAIIVCALAITLVFSQSTNFSVFRIYGPAENWKCALVDIGLLTWGVFLVCAGSSQNSSRKIVLYGASPLLFMFITYFVLPNQLKERRAPGELLLRHLDRIKPGTILVSDDDPVRAVCWFYKRCDVYLLNKGGELGYGLSYDDSKNRRLSISQFRDLVGTTSGKGNVILIMKTGKFSEYDSLIPKPSFKDMDACFGFAQF